MIAIWINYVAAALLAYIVLLNLRHGSIPNWGVLALVGLFVVKVIAGWGDFVLWHQLVFAACALALGLAFYATEGFGGGVVKLMFGASLFMPPAQWAWMLFAFVALTILVTVLSVLVRRTIGNEESSWAVLQGKIVPMAVPIAITAWIGIFVF
ncbi:prepilin peptidase [Aestuariibius insulae]|uniref:prepilin peptidase n=1 Tax=Aestuariibius insulae TaxID=2058287 RepID=UPI00345E9D61